MLDKRYCRLFAGYLLFNDLYKAFNINVANRERDGWTEMGLNRIRPDQMISGAFPWICDGLIEWVKYSFEWRDYLKEYDEKKISKD